MMDAFAGAVVQRLASLQDRGCSQLAALFLEAQPRDDALRALKEKSDVLSLAQQVVFLHAAGEHAASAQVQGRLAGEAPGISAVLDGLQPPVAATEDDAAAALGSVPGGALPGRSLSDSLGQWLTNVRGWREVLGV